MYQSESRCLKPGSYRRRDNISDRPGAFEIQIHRPDVFIFHLREILPWHGRKQLSASFNPFIPTLFQCFAELFFRPGSDARFVRCYVGGELYAPGALSHGKVLIHKRPAIRDGIFINLRDRAAGGVTRQQQGIDKLRAVRAHLFGRMAIMASADGDEVFSVGEHGLLAGVGCY